MSFFGFLLLARTCANSLSTICSCRFVAHFHDFTLVFTFFFWLVKRNIYILGKNIILVLTFWNQFDPYSLVAVNLVCYF